MSAWLACIAAIGSAWVKRPSIIRTYATTPRYWSNSESKIQGARGRLDLALGRRDPLDDRLQNLPHPLPGLRRDPEGLGRVAPEQVGDLVRDAIGIGARQVDLVQHRDQLEAGFDRRVGVGDRLRLSSLGGIDHQQRPLAGGEAARIGRRSRRVAGVSISCSW